MASAQPGGLHMSDAGAGAMGLGIYLAAAHAGGLELVQDAGRHGGGGGRQLQHQALTAADERAQPEEPMGLPGPPPFVPGALRDRGIGLALEGLFEQSMHEEVSAPPADWAQPGAPSFREALGSVDGGSPEAGVFLSLVELPASEDGQEAQNAPSGRAISGLDRGSRGAPGRRRPAAAAGSPGTLEPGAALAAAAFVISIGTVPDGALASWSMQRQAGEDPAGADGRDPDAPPGQRRRRRRIRAFDLVRLCSRVGPLRTATADKCTVCLEELRLGQRVRTLPCFHALHDKCSARYFRACGVQPTCPVCRRHVAGCE
mmetsp:Transcript_108760/g.351123  ORF Transcript_108760/g.351123 Transcript_108760/m.351123 type:complete len:316 (+) Transcript_108760:44-991(+)